VKNLVAKLEVTAVRPDGERLAIKVEIGRPRQERDGRWACPIAVAPLRSKFEDLRGADSFHAVWLACALTFKLLANLKAEGWQLLNDDGSEFPLAAYLCGLDGGPQ
jgi:hypothetical protein